MASNPPAFGPEQARALLEQAGWTYDIVSSFKGVRERFTFRAFHALIALDSWALGTIRPPESLAVGIVLRGMKFTAPDSEAMFRAGLAFLTGNLALLEPTP